MDEKHWKDPSPWVPMTVPVDQKHIGKLLEELGEATAAASRCFIQGVDEVEPSTKKPNREWLENELADVIANIQLCIEHFGLDGERMGDRAAFKKTHLRAWHQMLVNPKDWVAPR